MISLAICDDDRRMREDISGIVDKSCNKGKIAYRKELFEGSSELLDEVNRGKYFDILLLDIEMPEGNGLTLALDARKVLPDAVIIFVTFHEKYVYKSFEVQPFRFVRKNRMEDELPVAVEEAIKLVQACEGKFLVVENQRFLEKVPLKNIVYIWHKGKYSYIERTDGKCTKARKSLKEVYDELSKEEFVWADRGYIVALGKILKFGGREVTLTNNEKLYLSQGRIENLKKQVRDFWMGRG